MGYSPTKSIYYNPNIEYMFNTNIHEYDVQSAALSISKQFNLLPKDEIRRLSLLEKGERVVAIGKLQRSDRNFSQNLSEKFIEVRRIFLEKNNLDDNRIISVKKDALFVIGTCPRLDFGEIHFSLKNTYSSYIRFSNNQNIEIYYSSDNMDIKGIGEAGIARHRLYMIPFLKRVISNIETKNKSLQRYMKSTIDAYKAGTLDEGYYLEFNNMSQSTDPMFNHQNVIVPLVFIILQESSIY